MGAGSNADGSYAGDAGCDRGAAAARLWPRREGPRRRRFDGDEGALCVLKKNLTRELPGPEGDDSAHRVVRGNANGDTIAGNDLDSEPPHPTTQLGEHLVTGVALHAIQPAGMDCDHGSLHINQIVFAQ
jgi:hypothetical protein